jgi:hypothetical protein
MFYATGLPGWMRFGDWLSPTGEQEAGMLKSRAEWLQRELEAINKRLADLEGKP